MILKPKRIAIRMIAGLLIGSTGTAGVGFVTIEEPIPSPIVEFVDDLEFELDEGEIWLNEPLVVDRF